MTDWLNDVIPRINELLGEYPYKPTIRAIFYRLVSENKITNTFQTYKGLVQALGNARKKKSNDERYVNPDAIGDDTRHIEDIKDHFWTQEEYIKYLVDRLKNAHEEYFDNGYLPAWHEQENYVEIMIEKDALRGAIKSILPKDYVRLIPNRGWDSISFRNDNIRRLYWKIWQESKKVYVLYFGDYDPSGQRMSKNYEKWLSKYRIKLVRVALNKDQISKYSLDHLRNPDPEELSKLQKDPNKYDFMNDNDGGLFQIEMDAVLKNANDFKDLVLDAIKPYYDQEVHAKLLKQYTPRKINQIVRKKVKFLD